MKNRVKEIKFCQAWVGSSNSRCKKRVIMGRYCFFHYPKKEPIIIGLAGLIIGAFLSLLITVTFYDPVVHSLSKCSLFYYLDKKGPVIESVTPDIIKLPVVNKTTRVFKLSFAENDSGLNVEKSLIKISRKDKGAFVPMQGLLNKTQSELSYVLEKDFEFGEYLFESMLVDKANNKKEFRVPFVVREGDELSISVEYVKLGDPQSEDWCIDFLKNKPYLLRNNDLYILSIILHNKDRIATLKNVYLNFDLSGILYYWKEIMNSDVEDAIMFNPAQALNKLLPEGRIFTSWGKLKIAEMRPNSLIRFAVLVGEDRHFQDVDAWKGIDVGGDYYVEGYNSNERREIEVRLPFR